VQNHDELEKAARAIVERWYDCLSRMDIEA